MPNLLLGALAALMESPCGEGETLESRWTQVGMEREGKGKGKGRGLVGRWSRRWCPRWRRW